MTGTRAERARSASGAAPGRASARRTSAAIFLLALAAAFLVRPTGCAPNSHFAFIRSLSHGQFHIDRYHWQTCDKSYFQEHFYAAKAPGLGFVALPVHKMLGELGAVGERLPSVSTWEAVYDDTRTAVWPLTLWSVVLPTAVLLLLVSRIADRISPGFGGAVALTLGVGTLILPYSSILASHLLAAFLGFLAFALAFWERAGPPRLGRVALAGLAAGYAVTTEYPLAIVLVLVCLYVASRPAGRVLRAVAYGGGVAVGLAPLAVFNQLAFGSVRHLSYADAVINQGQSGHDVVGANSEGFFGVAVPTLGVAADLMFGNKGLLTLTPVLGIAIIGLIAMFRSGHRAEAVLIAAVAVSVLGYNAGYYLPFGGDTPGPRFLIPTLPFLALPLAAAWRRAPHATTLLALVSAAPMLAATLTEASWGGNAVRPWLSAALQGDFTRTLLGLAGLGSGWFAMLPFFAALAVALAFAARAMPRPALSRHGLTTAVAALAAWLVVAGVGPALLDTADETSPAVAVFLLAAAAVVTAIAADRRGVRALAAGLPLLVLLVPDLARSVETVAIAASCALLLNATPTLRHKRTMSRLDLGSTRKPAKLG